MKWLNTVERVYRQRPVSGWMLTLAGFALPLIGAFGIYGLYSAADFSSEVRDQYEKPPGVMSYTMFGLAIAVCGSFIGAGLLLVWTRFRKYVSA